MGVKIRDFTFTHAGAAEPVIKEICLDAVPGEIVFIVGGSGSGKSTLLACLAGIAPHQVRGSMSGEIIVNGIKAGSNGFNEPPAGLLPQDSDVYLFEDVTQEIAYPLLNEGLDEAAVRVRLHELAGAFEINYLLGRKMSTLSGGERKKVTICTSLAADRSVLLLDEPAEQLDPDAAHGVYGVLRTLADRGKTILVADRKRDYADIYADRVLILQEGRITSWKKAVDEDDGQGCREGAGYPVRRAYNPSVVQQVAGNVLPLPASLYELSHIFPGGGGLSNISLDIYPGEVLAVMGPNGAGKSTLVKHFNGLLKPQQGRAHIFGEDTLSLPVWKVARKVGILFQNPDDQIFNERVDKEVAWTLVVRGMEWQQAMAEAEKVLAEINIRELFAQHPHTLSRARRQMVALASVLVARPELIVLDEPGRAMDDELIDGLMAVVLKYKKKNGAVVIVTHDPFLAWRYADRTAIIAEGRLVGVGKTPEIFNNTEMLAAGRLARHPFISRIACKTPSSKVGDQQAVKLKVGDIPLTQDPGSKERCVPIS